MFPLYRKYSNNKSYFKVFDNNTFEEIQVLGFNYWVHQFEAKILPDRNLIKDMIELEGGHWTEISADAYLEFKRKCDKDFKKRE